MTASVSSMPGTLAELHPDQWTGPFWDAAARHELSYPQCTRCGTARMPPRPFCWACQSQDFEWVTTSGAATIVTFTVVRESGHPQLRELVPFVIAVVALAERPEVRLITNIVGAPIDAIRIGASVQVVWDDTAAGTTIPRFELAEPEP
jgi:uncharacterized OB-fold protein